VVAEAETGIIVEEIMLLQQAAVGLEELNIALGHLLFPLDHITLSLALVGLVELEMMATELLVLQVILHLLIQ
jgi:hypothetical protein